MLTVIAVLIVVTAVVIIPRMRVSGNLHVSELGWMSERWLAEHRAARYL